MNDKDNLIKSYNYIIELGISPLDVYLLEQVFCSESGFALEDMEAAEMVKKIRDNMDRDYNSKYTLEEHIERVLTFGESLDDSDESDEEGNDLWYF